MIVKRGSRRERFYLTRHAVTRWQERVRDVSPHETRQDISRLIQGTTLSDEIPEWAHIRRLTQGAALVHLTCDISLVVVPMGGDGAKVADWCIKTVLTRGGMPVWERQARTRFKRETRRRRPCRSKP